MKTRFAFISTISTLLSLVTILALTFGLTGVQPVYAANFSRYRRQRHERLRHGYGLNRGRHGPGYQRQWQRGQHQHG